VDGVIPFFV